MTTTPTINLNGTDQRKLLQDYLLAIHAMRAALSYTGMTAPHARDYQSLTATGMYAHKARRSAKHRPSTAPACRASKVS
jgi:hypothetical protein